MKITVGHYIERESRIITRCPSYYAADHETITTQPGRYPLTVEFVGGYLVPMPQWVLASVTATRVDGRVYSGFGGVNYSSQALPEGEAVMYEIQTYTYLLRDMVEAGNAELDPAFAWLKESKCWEDPCAPKTWDELRAMASQEVAA